MHKINKRVLARGGYYRRSSAGTLHSPTAPAATSVTRQLPGSASDFGAVSRRYVRWLVLVDLVVGFAAFGTAALFDLVLADGVYLSKVLVASAALLWPFLIGVCGGYQRRGVGVGTRELSAVLRAGPVLVVLGAYPAALFSQLGLLTIVALSVPVCVGLSIGARFWFRRRLHNLQSQGIGSRRTLAVGPVDAVASLRLALEHEAHCGMQIVGACTPAGATGDSLGVPVVGDLKQVRAVVEKGGYEAVAVTGGECLREDYLRRLSWSLEGADVELLVAPGLSEIARPRLDIRPLMGVPLLHIAQPEFTGWRHVVKRTLDVILTTIGLVALSPLLVSVALAIKLQDGGPILFRQSRVGRDGQPFGMLKFRSMVVDAEARKAELMARNEGHGALFKIKNDPRITPLGRFIRNWSIDELPQLFNVLGGSMALVGPRPHLAHEVAAMPADASRRALVTPGLTGLWQISGRSDLPGSEGVRLDLRYVENWSITLDLFIIWKTFRAVLMKSGAR